MKTWRYAERIFKITGERWVATISLEMQKMGMEGWECYAVTMNSKTEKTYHFKMIDIDDDDEYEE